MNEYLTFDNLYDSFTDWMKEKNDIDDTELVFILYDLDDMDSCEWLIPSPEEDAVIEGKTYRTTLFETDLSIYAIYDVESGFNFYRFEPLDDGECLFQIKDE